MDATLRPLADAVAVIDEARCIGCTLCIRACPVDAIIGASRFMHTVVAAWCTGCELCIPPCPVDCIAIEPIAARDAERRALATHEAQRRHAGRNARLALARERAEKTVRSEAQRNAAAARRKRETIARAIARARERLAVNDEK